jgi:hypothetical protein
VDSVYVDLESAADRAKLSDAELYLADHEDRLVILDELPEINRHVLEVLREPLESGHIVII